MRRVLWVIFGAAHRSCKGLIVVRRVFASQVLTSILLGQEAAIDSTECLHGGLLSIENSVPGAYESSCMSLPERFVTVGNTELQIKQGQVQSGSTGMALWNSSLLLTRLLESMKEEIEGKDIIELGCGTGLTSLAAASLGARRVLATDGNSDVVKLAANNVYLNKLSEVVDTRVLQWGVLTLDDDLYGVADLVVGSDLTYNAGSWPLLTETMESMLKPSGKVIYLTVGHSGFSSKSEIEGFVAVAKSKGLSREKKNTSYEQLLGKKDARVDIDDVQVVVLQKK